MYIDILYAKQLLRFCLMYVFFLFDLYDLSVDMVLFEKFFYKKDIILTFLLRQYSFIPSIVAIYLNFVNLFPVVIFLAKCQIFQGY